MQQKAPKMSKQRLDAQNSKLVRRVVVESPYKPAATNPEEAKKELLRNETYARLCLHDCFMHGEAPFASHLLYTQPGVLRDHDEHERALGIEAGLMWVREANATIVYTDFGISDGMKKGIARAIDDGRPVEYRRLPQEAMEELKNFWHP